MPKRLTAKEIAEIIYSSGIKVGDEYIHNKTSKKYIVLFVSVMEDTLEPAVVYAPTNVELGYSISFIRTVDEFKEKFINV